MELAVSDVCRQLEAQGLLKRLPKDQSEGIVQQVRELLGGRMPADLEAFYRERVARIGDFVAIVPKWNTNPEWQREGEIGVLKPVQAVPIFSDGSGSLYGLDLSAGDQRPAIYFFDHEDLFDRPRWAAGSSLGHFLLLLAQHDQAIDEGRPTGWELSIDPDIDKCPRAPPLWLAD